MEKMSSQYRLVDANINRVVEGLRVIEDLCRFMLRDQRSATQLKEHRHALRSMWGELQEELIAARDVGTDRGFEATAEGEYERANVYGIAKANFCRAEESMRVLEEFAKMTHATKSKRCERIRYQLYQLEKNILEQILKKHKTYPAQALYVLVTQKWCKKDPLEVVEAICRGGADVIQLREKDMEDGEFLDWVRKVKEVTDAHDVPLIVNDRVHLVLLSGAQGVHLGQGDLKTSDARQLMGEDRWIGRSTHGIDQAEQAQAEGVDYIGVGPLFLTQTKEHRCAVGVKYLEEVENKCQVPYVGIGAVNRENWDEIMVAKPKGLAICTAIIGHEDPEGETRFYKSALERVWA